jgi:tetratricopeptide (TPR) repeat protein
MLKEDPQDREVLQSLARIAIQHNKIEQAIEYLERLSLNPSQALEASRIQQTLAEAYNALGNVEKEKEALQAALDLDGTDVLTFAALGRLYRRTESWNDLISLLAREFQVRQDPERLGCRKEIAEIAEEKLQNHELALEEWLKVYEIVGGDREVLRSLCSLSLKIEDYEGYVRYSTKLLEILNIEDAAALCLSIANIYVNKLREEGTAVQYWEKALEGENSFQEASEHLEVNYLLLGEWQKLYYLLLRQQEVETDISKRVAVLLRVAEIAETSLMNNDLSKEAFDIILEIDPQNMNAIQKRSQYLYQTKAWGDLVSLYSDSEQRYLSRGSDFEQKQEQLQFYYQFAEALIALDEEDAAVQKLERALQINPSHISSLKLLAGVCFKIGNWTDAYDKYQRLLLLVDGSSDASILWKIYLNLGFCALRLGDVEKAIGYYQKSRLRNPASLLISRGLAECHFVKEEYSRAAQLCSNIVERAVETEDVVFGFSFRGF